jgi:phosphate transport system substrate-binding protein
MVKGKKWAALLALFAALGVVAAACTSGDDDGGDTTGGETTGGSDPTGATAEGLSGTIVISGSSTVLPISSIVAEVFNETNPDVSISVDGPGTGDGFALFCDGETDISDASRPIEQEEIDACAANGVEFTELEVAFDGITVMTNPDNSSVECLNLGDLYALFGPESDGFASWSDGNDLATQVGGNGGFPDEPLEITAPGTESGTYDAFIELSGIEETAVAQGLPEEEAASLRTDYQASPDDNVIIQAMEGSSSALGFVGFAYAQEAGDQIKEVQVDGGDGCVAPSAESIADASYPLSRSLFIYVNNANLGDPALKAYVDFYLSDDSLTSLVGEVGYVSLPQDRIDATRSAWEAASA